MSKIFNFTIKEKLYDGLTTKIYKVVKPENNEQFIVKMLKSHYPDIKNITKFKHEYKIAKNLDFDGILMPYELKRHDNNIALIMEYFDGESLKSYIKDGPLELDEFLTISIALSDILYQFQRKNIIHKDIKPSNILFNKDTKEVKITGFGIATATPRYKLHDKIELIEGTLAYISPEQTGRINSLVDWRTDFYSLGVTLYEIITGKLPIDNCDPIELIHSLLSKAPIPACEVNSAVPKTVSKIIKKLLSKNPGDRYQNANALKMDFERCLREYKSHGTISDFPIAQNDISEKFYIPQIAYGRDEEIEYILREYKLLKKNYKSFIGISAPQGLGKTFLIQSLCKKAADEGYFLSGTFADMANNIPYSTFIDAIKRFVKHIANKNISVVEKWIRHIIKIIKGNELILFHIPELEELIQDKYDYDCTKKTSQKQLQFVIRDILCSIAAYDFPILLFLDDLHHADLLSLQLIQLILDSDEGTILIVGAYRSNEIHENHILTQKLEKMKEEHHIPIIQLFPIKIYDIICMLSAIFSSTNEKVTSLAKVIFDKTQGNPFFIRHFLEKLYNEDVFEFTLGEWNWDINKVQEKEITDDILEFTISKLKNLKKNAQKVLQLASCIGETFDLEMVSILSGFSEPKVAMILDEAVTEGLVLPLGDLSSFFHEYNEEISKKFYINKMGLSYKFFHNRIKEAAYSLLIKESKDEKHLEVGKILLERKKEGQDNVFKVLEQLNNVQHLLADHEKIELACLNLEAAKRSRGADNIQAALKYIEFSEQLIPSHYWDKDLLMCFDIRLENAKIKYLSMDYPLAKKIFLETLPYAKNIKDRLNIFSYMIAIESILGEDKNAEEYLCKGANLIKSSFFSNFSFNIIQNSFLLQTISKFDTYYYQKKEKEPIDPVVEFIVFALPWIKNKNLFVSLTIKLMFMIIKSGNAKLASIAYSYYSMVLISWGKNYEAGYRIGKQAIKIAEMTESETAKSISHKIFGLFINQWSNHASGNIPILNKSIVDHIPSIPIIGSLNSHYMILCNMFFVGNYLAEVHEKVFEYSDTVMKASSIKGSYDFETLKKTMSFLRGQNTSHIDQIIKKNGWSFTSEITSINRTLTLLLLYLFGYYDKAYEIIKNISFKESYIQCFITMNVFFYSALVLLKKSEQLEGQALKETLKKAQIYKKKIEIWAHKSPVNFRHKHLILEAEIHRIKRKQYVAMDYYDRAIRLAITNEYVQDEALANELAGKFYLQEGKTKIAQTYLLEAHYSYKKWGALAKVNELERTYAHILNIKTITSFENSDFRFMTSLVYSSGVDLQAIFNITKSISSEILLDKLLIKLMKGIIDISGAQKGFFILNKENQLYLAAEYFLDSNINIFQNKLLESSKKLSLTIIRYVKENRENVILHNALRSEKFNGDPYIIKNKAKSILCIPVCNQNKLVGILYLENNIITYAFYKRFDLLKMLSSQVAIYLENAKLYEKEKEIDALATLGKFSSTISHEIRNPMAAISLNFESLKKRMEIPENCQKIFKNIEFGINRVENIVNGILDFVRSPEPELFLVSINKTLQNSLYCLDKKFEECNIKIQENYDKEVKKIKLDPYQIGQVFDNLIRNSCEAMPEGGVLKVGTKSKEDYIEVTIEDNGVGISPENQKNIFKPFFTTKKKGTGLGMAVISQILSKHKWNIFVDSEEGAWTKFTLLIPFNE